MIKNLISVIVPVYNAEKYLDQCISSILKQTYPNLELILINDGSTDNCEAICQKYVHQNRRVKYYSQKNAGAAAARNLGIEKAEGEYLGFVDSDDYIDKDMYQILFDTIKQKNAQTTQILSRRITDDGNIINQELIHKTEGLPCIAYTSNEAIEHYFTGNHSLWSHLYKASLFSNVKIPTDMSGEDLAVIIPLYSKCSKIVKINTYKYNYRFNPNSVTNTPLNQRKINLFYEYEKQLKKYSDDPFLKEILYFTINKTLAGIINAMILQEYDTINESEQYFRDKLKYYYPQFKKNRYIGKVQIRKYTLYLKCHLLYKLMLKFKRATYFKKALYGEE